MAARKKVTKTAKSGEAVGAVRIKPDTARAKVSGSRSAWRGSPAVKCWTAVKGLAEPAAPRKPGQRAKHNRDCRYDLSDCQKLFVPVD